jgi:hypothetical protein
LNLERREGQGTISEGDKDNVLRNVKDALLKWKGPDGRNVVQSVGLGNEVLEGPLVEYGPDLLVGYSPGYRASADTGLGKWGPEQIELNSDHWEADHCIDPSSVQGVLFAKRGLEDYPTPTYHDIPALTVGKAIKGAPPPPPEYDEDEDQDVIEERLKGLGYL